MVYAASTFHRVTFPYINSSQIKKPDNHYYLDSFVSWLKKACDRKNPNSWNEGIESRIRDHFMRSYFWDEKNR